MLSEDQKMGETKDISSFLLFLLFFREKRAKKCHFQYSKFLNYAKFPLPYHKR